ncbi:MULTISPECIES: 2-hydroxymuconate tautomerase [Mycobacteriaceae]|uniref:Tautomerase family protein n=1 Tax=Mycolicibacterium parafortuitum TaxID=39692 RepID=A0ACC6MA99_MYCPF|nr:MULTISPECIES: 2-hydroxymuconate tautomerase [Mycobacteriaceae]MDZ5083855.1 tautomerase family protein [Mycolicibacterium parafortuitum]GFM16668.1 4-oxalocrotonate tautomerase family enzyme [Mycobacterium sp. PO1]GFM21649.1 4-oxalocrotonate tautomerase family enzyme [Mycobacterium sp. PO2]
MPFVTVHMWDGRTDEQKRRLARAITDAMVEHAGASPDHLHVAISEYPPQDWARAGVLGSDIERHGVLGSEKPPLIYGLGHLLLQTTDLAAAENFYIDFLGLTVRKREDFRDGRPLVVTHQGLGLTTGRPDGGNPVEHVAFRARNLPAIARRAEERGITIVSGPEPSGYGLSLYMLDPDGNKVEMIGDAPGT